MTPLLVGNDVVDLADPRCVGKWTDERFLRRVLAPEEARAVRRSPHPDALLWLHWAAKEAAYKVASKLRREPPPFTHAGFRVRLDDPAAFPGGSGRSPNAPRGRVAWEELRIPFRAWVDPDRIHVVAWWAPETGGSDALPGELSAGVSGLPTQGPPDGWREELSQRFSAREWDPIHSWPSAVVRLEARAELARRLETDESRLAIVSPGDSPGRVPPEVLRDGRGAPADVSLSHHGRFVAWAVAVGGATAGSEGGR